MPGLYNFFSGFPVIKKLEYFLSLRIDGIGFTACRVKYKPRFTYGNVAFYFHLYLFIEFMVQKCEFLEKYLLQNPGFML